MVKRIIAAATLLCTLQPSYPVQAASTLPAAAPVAVATEVAAPGAPLPAVATDGASPGAPLPAAATETKNGAAPADPLRAETPRNTAPAGEVDKLSEDYLKGYFTDTGKIINSPLHWESKDWMKAGLVLGGTGALFLMDRRIRDFAQSNQSSVASGFAKVGNSIGDPFYIYPSVGAFYLYGQLADDSKARRVSLLALESLTISGALTTGLKTLAGRHRPKVGDVPMTFDGPLGLAKNVSFSSGHSSNAFSVATVVANEYKDNPYVAPLAYGLATLTALSRVYSNEHWGSDVFFGAAVGYLVSKAVLSYHKEDKDKLGNRLTLMPQVGKEMTGLTVNYKF